MTIETNKRLLMLFLVQKMDRSCSLQVGMRMQYRIWCKTIFLNKYIVTKRTVHRLWTSEFYLSLIRSTKYLGCNSCLTYLFWCCFLLASKQNHIKESKFTCNATRNILISKEVSKTIRRHEDHLFWNFCCICLSKTR